MRIVIGLNHGSHDAAAAIMVDERLRLLVEQERISRRRYALGELSTSPLIYGLAHLGLSLKDVDEVALGSDHRQLAEYMALDEEETKILLPYDPENWLRSHGLLKSCPVTSVPHHLAHAQSAFWPSGFRRAAVLVVDAMGEEASASMGVASRDSGVRIKPRLTVDESLGFFYEAATDYVGLGPNSAGKLMGLAAYGNPHGMLADTPAHEVMRMLGHCAELGRARIITRTKSLIELFASLYFPYCKGDGTEPLTYADFAASAQRSLELSMSILVEEAVAVADSRDVVLSGGVALNCSSNGITAKNRKVNRIFVQPASIDSGVAFGAALAVCEPLLLGSEENVTFDPFIGPSDDFQDFASAARLASHLSVRQLSEKELVVVVANLLRSGRIVAWHQGATEIGPRALGARSLLADPRRRDSTSRLNAIKERESWRPIAPSILEHRFSDYFDGVANQYMLVACEVRQNRREEIPAVVHVDMTARPQTVSEKMSPLFFDLLTEFERITGCPVLANTSLNPKGRAPSAGAIGTVDFFLAKGEIDAVALGPFLIERT